MRTLCLALAAALAAAGCTAPLRSSDQGPGGPARLEGLLNDSETSGPIDATTGETTGDKPDQRLHVTYDRIHGGLQ